MQPSDSPLPPPPQQQYAIPVPVFVGAVLVVMLAFICGLGAIGVIPSIRGLKSPTGTAKPTLQQTPVTGATLGGTLGDFAQRYGTSVDASGLMYAGTLAGQRVLIVVALDDVRQSRDGQNHIIAVDVQVPGDALGVETWDAATAYVIALTFLPADAQFQSTVTLSDETHYVYHSDALAATFLPGQYTNIPGSLNFACHLWPPAVTPAASGTGDSHSGVYGQRHIGIGNE